MIHFHAQYLAICYLKGIEKQLLYNDLMYNALHFNIFSIMTSSADEKCYFWKCQKCDRLWLI